MLDFAKLKTETPITQVLGMLNINHLTERGDILRGCCPLCKHEDARAFVVTPAKGTFYCFKERQGGDIIRLVARARELKDREAAQWIADQGAGKRETNESPKQEVSTSRKVSTFDPLAYQQALDPEHADLPFDAGALRHFGGGYASKGLHRGRLALPIYDSKDAITGFVGIALKGEEPELLYPKDFVVPFYMGSQFVTRGTLYVASHIKDMLTAYEGGVENVIALLQPISADTLVCLTALMREKNCTELELLP